jgi:hypothetical protein
MFLGSLSFNNFLLISNFNQEAIILNFFYDFNILLMNEGINTRDKSLKKKMKFYYFLESLNFQTVIKIFSKNLTAILFCLIFERQKSIKRTICSNKYFQ